MIRNLSQVQRTVVWFLVVSYIVGAPAMAVAEYYGHFLSEMFGYAPEFIYLIKISQVVCAVLLLTRLATWGIVMLTIFAVGAFASFLSIHSPLASLPPLVYAVLQIWIGWHINNRRQMVTRPAGD
jgi:hypothetical protein